VLGRGVEVMGRGWAAVVGDVPMDDVPMDDYAHCPVHHDGHLVTTPMTAHDGPCQRICVAQPGAGSIPNRGRVGRARQRG
jgi:hypothetical protein